MNPTPPNPNQQAGESYQDALLNLADVMGPISHELQNIFNGIVLQSAIVARKAPAELEAEIKVFRELALQGSNILNWLDRHRHRIRPTPGQVDLFGTTRGAVELLLAEGIEVVGDLPSAAGMILGYESDVRRLVTLLIRCAGLSGSSVTVRGWQEEESVYLQVVEANSERDIDPERFFDLNPLTSERSDYAVCRTIARRLGARIEVAKQDEGLVVKLEFKAAGESS